MGTSSRSAPSRERRRGPSTRAAARCAPGFIDMHTHSDMTLVTDGNGQSKIRQGVTTEVIGESDSVAPRKAAVGGGALDRLHRLLRHAREARHLAEPALVRRPRHDSRAWSSARSDRKPTADRAGDDEEDGVEPMDQGVFGVSTGLIYPPNAYADVEELVELSKPAADKGGLYASHMRYDGPKLRRRHQRGDRDRRARAACPCTCSTSRSPGQRNFGRMKEVIKLVEAARARGVRVTADQYPYVASSTGLTATIPPWAQDGGAEKLVARLKDPDERARIRKEMEDTNPDVGEPLPVRGHVAERSAGGDWPHARRRRARRCRRTASTKACASTRPRSWPKQGSVRLRVRPADRGARLGGLRRTSSSTKRTSRWR